METERTNIEIANTALDCLNGGIVLSGSQLIVRNGQNYTLRAGDLVLVDSSVPHKLSVPERVENIAFLLPKGVSPVLDEDVDFLIVPGHRVSIALRSCFHFLADRFTSQREANAIYEALLALLPIDANCYYSGESDKHTTALFREILHFVNQNLQDYDLSPGAVARHFGISESYVFKLYARNGLRFGAYLTSRRLEGAARELSLMKSVGCRISAIAFEWGFNDLSTFDRAFKRKYGCTPRQFRAP